MKDRFTRGFLSGIIAGAPTLAFALLAISLNWTTIRWAHFTAKLLYGRIEMNLMENIFATVTTFFFCGGLGVIFAFVIPRISSLNYILKGWFFGSAVWFLAFAITKLFNVPQMTIIPFNSVVINFIEASIWGVSLGYCLKWMDERVIV